MTPGNPDFEQAVREGFARQPFMAHIGARVAAVRPGFVELRVPYREEVGQNHGFFHGGVIGSMADVAGGFAGYSLLPPSSSVLTVEYKINIIAPGKGDELVARGQVLRAGRTLIFTDVKVSVVNGGEEALVAVALQTLRGMTGGPGIAF